MLQTHLEIGKTSGTVQKRMGAWDSSEFERIWKEMDSIEPLSPVNQSQRKD